MADILSQDEVDLLLSAVSEEGAEVGEEEEAPAFEHVTAHDFRRPERVSKEQLRGLQGICEAFAREWGVALPGYLRTATRVELSSIDQLTYDMFVLSVARPTALSVISMAPMEGNALLEIGPSLVFPIVDRLLGGRGIQISEPRPLTEIEERLVLRIIHLVIDCLARAWRQLISLELKVVAQESDPLIVQIVGGSEMVILVTFELHVAEVTGTLNLCVPLLTISAVLDKIGAQGKYGVVRPKGQAAERAALRLREAVHNVSVGVDACIGSAVISVRDLMELQVGDILQLDTSVRDHVEVRVGNMPKFLGKPGKVGNKSAVQIVGHVG